MALTLVEASKIALGRDEALKATVMELFARNSDILQYMPFENIQGNALRFNREKNLPGVAFRGVNEGYTESTGEVEAITESLAIAGGDLDVDVFLLKTAGEGQRAVQEQMKIKALALSLTKAVIKGDVTSDPKSFDGLQVRCTGDQLIQNSATATAGTALSLAKLDELIDAVEDPTHLIMNKTMARLLTAAARLATVSGNITWDLDSFGRRVMKYNDLPILKIDKDESNADIMAFDEIGQASTNATYTSIYCVSFAENGMLGLQSAEMDVRDLGEQDSKPVVRTRVEWYVTVGLLRPRSAARLCNIENGAVVI